MILGTKARYAVMALVEMARRDTDKPVSLAELSESQEITVPYLEQIFRKLKAAGLVKSVRGPGGGYVLGMQADMIAILDIVVAVDESTKMTRCDSKSSTGCMASKSRCLTHDLWEGLSNQISVYLSSVSLADVSSGKLGK